MANRSWADLPADIFGLVADHLSYIDIHRSRFVCKKWLCFDDERKRRANLLAVMKVNWYVIPFSSDPTKICQAKVFAFPSNTTFLIQNVLHEQKHSNYKVQDLCCSDSGWLLYLKRGSDIASWRSFFFYSLVHNQILELPSLQWNNIRGIISDRIIIEFQMTMQKAVFSSSPSSPDCVIFILWNTVTVDDVLERSKYFTITTYKDRRWSIYENPCLNGETFEDAAYACGVFYCALVNDYAELTLGTFDVALQEWEVMDDSTCLELNYGPVYLVNFGSNDLLLASFHEYDRQTEDFHCCHIYRFDLSQKEWTTVASLGNRILIISQSVKSSNLYPAAGGNSKYANMILHSSRRKINEFYACEGDDEGEWEWRLSAKKDASYDCLNLNFMQYA